MSLLFRLTQLLVYHFWIVWLFGLAGILAVSIGIHRSGDWQPFEPAAKSSRLQTACFGAFLVLYLGFMFWNEDFAWMDGHVFTDFSAIGITRPPSVWPNVGRFWPMGYQEYNLISHVSKTATAYLVFGAIQLIAGLWFLYEAMPAKTPALRLSTLALLMLAPAFAADFAELTYADRNVVFAVCVLVFCVSRYDREPALRWMIPPLVVSYWVLYDKETTTALFGTFAAARMLLKASRDGWRSALRSPLEIGMIIGSACFAGQLGIVLIQNAHYLTFGFVGRWTATGRYLTADPLLAAFLIAFAIHVVQTLRRGAKLDPLWDALALGGVLHFCAVAVTGLEEDFLMGPTELIAALTLVRLLPAFWSERARLRPILAVAASVLAAVTVTFGTYRLIQRKVVVGQTKKLADFLISYSGREKARLYFRDDGGQVESFVSYLSYRGLPIRRAGAKPAGGVEVAGSEPFPGDLCVDFVDFVCKHDEPRPGDLLVHLALEPWQPAAKEKSFQPLFESSPASFFPSLRPVLSALHRLSPTLYGVFKGEPLPDDWLRVSVTTAQKLDR